MTEKRIGGVRISLAGKDDEALVGGRTVTEINEYLESLDGESQRGLVLTLAAVLDDLARSYLEEIFSFGPTKTRGELYDFNGPFGSFSSRIKVLHTLGKIGDNFARDMHTIRRIRNRSAHEWSRFSLLLDRGPIEEIFQRRVPKGVVEGLRNEVADEALDLDLKFKWCGAMLIVALAGRRAAESESE